MEPEYLEFDYKGTHYKLKVKVPNLTKEEREKLIGIICEALDMKPN